MGATVRRPAVRRLLATALTAGALVSASLVVASPAQAAGSCTRTWDGGSTGSWHTAANWQGDVLPTASDEVCIGTGVTVAVTQSVDVRAIYAASGAPGSVTISNGAILQLTGGTGVLESELTGVTVTHGRLQLQTGLTVLSGGVTLDAISTSNYGILEAPPSPFALTLAGPFVVTGGETTRNGGGPSGVIHQLVGFTFSMSSKAVSGGTRVPFFSSTSVATANTVSLSGSAQLNGLDLSAPVVSAAAGTTFTQFNPGNSWSLGAIVTAGDAVLGASVALTGASSSLGGSLTLRSLSGPAAAALSVPAGEILEVAGTGGGSFAGTISGAGTVRQTLSTQFNLTGSISASTVLVTGGDLAVQSGAALSPTRLELVASEANARLLASSGSTVSIGADGLLLDSAGTGTYPWLEGELDVAGPVDMLGGFLQNATIAQTGDANDTTITPGLTSLALLSNGLTLTTAGDVWITGSQEMRSTAITAKRIRLATGAGITDLSVPNTNAVTAQGVITTGLTPSLALGSSGLTITGGLSDLGAGLSVEGPVTVSPTGVLTIPSSATLTATGTVTVQEGGTLAGDGTVAAAVVNNGTLAPGGPAVGSLNLTQYTQTSTGTLAIDVAGDSSFDTLDVPGPAAAVYGGTVSVNCLGGYAPVDGATFGITFGSQPPSLTATTVDSCDGTASTAVFGGGLLVSFAAPAATVPGAPGVTVSAKVESLDVTITAPADDGGSAITGYEITCLPACSSVTNPVSVGTTTLTGLTGGTSYAVSVVAVNGVGSSTPTTVTKTALAPAPTSTVSTTTAVVGSTSGSFKVTCSHNRGLVKACGAVLKGSNGTIYGKSATVTSSAGASTITVTVTINSAGITASKKLGGLAATVFITTTPTAPDTTKVTTKSIRVTQKTTSKTYKSSSFFTTSGTSLTSAGKTALIAVAKAVQGSKSFRCEVNVARTSSATNDYNRGLKRATAICAFVKSTIKARGWKPVGSYVLKSWGSTKPISLSKAWVKLSAGN